jgi:hypothetical protein
VALANRPSALLLNLYCAYRPAVSGKNFIAAMSAHSILSIYGRSFPTAMALVCSQQPQSQLRPPDFVSDPLSPDSLPEPRYVETVSASVREFKEAISAGDSARALCALCDPPAF